ncbi:MAG: hypothetical protein QHH30_09835, partial [candidate division NC10 bacterium]|nr:hypothetical protein [candidate division NC10 bacterium]
MLRIQKRSISVKRISLVLVDILIFQASFLLAVLLRFGFSGIPRYIPERWPAILLITPIFLMVFYVADLYQVKKDYRRPAESLRVASATAISLLLSIFLFYFLFYGKWSAVLGRGILTLYALLVFAAIWGWRCLFSHLGSKGVFSKKIILVGDPADLDKLQPLLQGIASDMDLKLGGLIALATEPAAPSDSKVPILGTTHQLLEVVAREEPDLLVLAFP